MVLALITWLLAPPSADPEVHPSERVEVVAVAPAPAQVETREPSPPSPPTDPRADSVGPEPTRRSWQAELFLDVGYGFNSNKPANHVYRGMVTNPRTNELSVGAVGAFVRHALRDDEPWLFELGLHAGAAVDARAQAEPVPAGPSGGFAGSEVFKHIAVANAGFALRKTKTVFAAGVFDGPLGVGSFWTFNNWNYTTSWESNVVPYYLTGAKIIQPLPRGFELAGWVVNGFQTYADLNSVPSGLVSLSWARPPASRPSPRTRESALTLSTQLYFGPEGVETRPEDWLLYWDTTAAYDLGDHFSLAFVWDLGVDRPGRGPETKSLYTGGALFARGTVLETKRAKLDLAVRPEASWDRDGRFFGVEQWLVSATGTATLTLFEHLLLRAEYRFDHSSAADGFFYRHELIQDDDLGLAQDQHIVFLSLAAWWDFWFGRPRSGF